MVLGGDVAAFKAGKGIGNILGFRTVINDGNTIVEHFWDNSFQYVLLHEIKYWHDQSKQGQNQTLDYSSLLSLSLAVGQ